VKLNPLTVLVSILLAVELAGVLGAFLAIPVAGMVQVVARDLWDHRRGAPKVEPTVGEDRVPAAEAPEAQAPGASAKRTRPTQAPGSSAAVRPREASAAGRTDASAG
jgi:hypothetical protein